MDSATIVTIVIAAVGGLAQLGGLIWAAGKWNSNTQHLSEKMDELKQDADEIKKDIKTTNERVAGLAERMVRTETKLEECERTGRCDGGHD